MKGLSLWVPNCSSTAVTCGIAVRWSSGMIVGRGGTTAVFNLPTGPGLAGALSTWSCDVLAGMITRLLWR
jgi:hypothetical protein